MGCKSIWGRRIDFRHFWESWAHSRLYRAIFKLQRASKCDIWRYMDFHEISHFLSKYDIWINLSPKCGLFWSKPVNYKSIWGHGIILRYFWSPLTHSRRCRAIFELQRASKCNIWRCMDFHEISHFLSKNDIWFNLSPKCYLLSSKHVDYKSIPGRRIELRSFWGPLTHSKRCRVIFELQRASKCNVLVDHSPKLSFWRSTMQFCIKIEKSPLVDLYEH